MSTIRSDRLAAALDRAVLAGDAAELLELLRRGSGLPGPRSNLDLARAVGHALARHEGRADRIVSELGRSDDEYLRIVAAAAHAARSLGKQRAPAERAMEALQELAEDPRHHVRLGVVEALRTCIGARGEAAVIELAAWTDGYLQAHVVLEALADRTILAALPSGDAVLARLGEAFALADASPRAAERSQGMRLLRQAMPAQIAAFAARFPETLGWLEERTASKRPETREVVAGAIAALRRAVVSDVEAERLSALLAASGKPPRDPSRIVAGMRNRSRGRR
jgi:hypothetical protein